MAKKRTYSTQSVDRVVVSELAASLAAGCIVALDVAKEKFVGALVSEQGEPVKLFRFEHPTQTSSFVAMVSELRRVLGVEKVRAAMEPTGTYGDSIRHQLQKLGVPIWMVAPKKTHDSQALFDDVASLHDPKCAVQVGKLCAMGLANRWAAPPPSRARLRALVELRGYEIDHEERCFGRLEALLARHWPELGAYLDIRTHKTGLALLTKFASPARVVENRDAARRLIHEASRAHFSRKWIDGFIAACVDTLGVPTVPEEDILISTLAEQAKECRGRAAAIEEKIRDIGKSDEVFTRLAPWMGPFTSAAIVTMCDPRQYAHARQLEKACGLNLREKSSGRDNDFPGRIRHHVTKRGPSLVRKLLYLFALRMIKQDPTVRAWCMRRRRYSIAKVSAVVAVMRKLVRAVFHVAAGSVYDASKLFDVRRLEIPLAQPEGATLPRTHTDSIAEADAAAI